MKDETEKLSLYIMNIPVQFEDDYLEKIFKVYGSVSYAKVKDRKDKKSKHKGKIGYVKLKSKPSFEIIKSEV